MSSVRTTPAINRTAVSVTRVEADLAIGRTTLAVKGDVARRATRSKVRGTQVTAVGGRVTTPALGGTAVTKGTSTTNELVCAAAGTVRRDTSRAWGSFRSGGSSITVASFVLATSSVSYLRKTHRAERYSPAFSAEFARSTTHSVLGTTSSPDRTADETSVTTTSTIRSDLTSLPWGECCSGSRLGSNNSWQKPEKADKLHLQGTRRRDKRLVGSSGDTSQRS
jgi:hypothetical protein